jgi:hypothetical protein
MGWKRWIGRLAGIRRRTGMFNGRGGERRGIERRGILQRLRPEWVSMVRRASRSVIRANAREWLSRMCPEACIRERRRRRRWLQLLRRKWLMLLLLFDSVDGRVGSTIVIASWALFCWMMTIVAATLVALRIVRHLGKRDLTVPPPVSGAIALHDAVGLGGSVGGRASRLTGTGVLQIPNVLRGQRKRGTSLFTRKSKSHRARTLWWMLLLWCVGGRVYCVWLLGNYSKGTAGAGIPGALFEWLGTGGVLTIVVIIISLVRRSRKSVVGGTPPSSQDGVVCRSELMLLVSCSVGGGGGVSAP